MSQSADPETDTLPEDGEDPSLTAALPESDPLADAQVEIAKWKDLSLRTAAELDNYRKRVTREAQESRAYANADVLRAMLPILDNFEMGLDAARAENEKSMIFQGLSMVRRQLQDFLREFGVEELNPVGQKFDPNLHEAVSQEPSKDKPEGIILKVMRRGFKLKDRLLRPAMVVVSSGDSPPHGAPRA
jgi:molecular chaperone GrpE